MNRITLAAVSVIVPVLWLIGGGIVLKELFVADRDDFVTARQATTSLSKNVSTTNDAFSDYLAAVNAAFRDGKNYQQTMDATATQRQVLTDQVTKRRQFNTVLATSKARQDAAVEKAYQAYVTKERAYLYYIEGYAEAYPSLSSSFRSCADIYEISDKAATEADLAAVHRTAARDCLEDLDRLGKGQFTPTADYANEFARIVNGRQMTFDGVANRTLDLSAASASIKKLGADSKANDPVASIKAAKEAARPGSELTSLAKALEAGAQKRQ